MTFVAGQTSNTPAENATSDGKATPAEEFLERVRQELQKHRSIKAEMSQVVSIGDQQFKITGEYLSSGLKLRLKYTIDSAQGVQGEMLEVCDGKELSTLLQVMDSPPSVTQRNVQQILEAAAAASNQKVPEATLNGELGMGGLTTLLASLSRNMTFDAMKADESNGHSVTMIQGRWKKERIAGVQKEGGDGLPPFFPDLVQIHVNSKTLFPEKIHYLKKQVQNSKSQGPKKSLKALLSLEFRDVGFDGPVDDDTFLFLVPPKVIPVDVTKQYLDRLTAPVSTPPAASVPAQN
jgi:outer membrane lipoprotein-sorting protein